MNTAQLDCINIFRAMTIHFMLANGALFTFQQKTGGSISQPETRSCDAHTNYFH